MNDIHPVDQSRDECHAARAMMRRRQFKKAMQFADENSQLEAVSFVPPTCRKCDDTISHYNRSDVHSVCQPCLEESTALRSMEIAKQSRQAEAERKDRGWITVVIVCGVVLLTAFICLWKAGVL